MADYKPLATQVAKRYGIPVGVMHGLVQQESGWNPAARNPSGATGIVQIHLPSHPDISEQQALNPRFALNWGAKYLKAQYDRFGSWKLALAAYNAGPGNVENGRWQSFPETKNYVKSILGYAGSTGSSASTGTLAPPPLAAPTGGLLPEMPTNGPDLAGLALQNLSELSSGGKPPSPTDMLSGLTMAVAAQPPQPPQLAASLPSPAPPSAAGAPKPQEQHSVKGFTPAFQKALNGLLAETGLSVTSGYRSPERQAELYAAAVKKYGSPEAARKWVAPPGRSKHNHGVAADLGGNLAVLNDAVLRKHGLWRPMPYEPWHVELLGSRG